MASDDVYFVAGIGGGFFGDGGAAQDSDLAGPGGLGLDSSGNLYIADSGNNVIREVLATGTLLTSGGPTLPKEMTGGSNPSELPGVQPQTATGDLAGTALTVNPASGELDANVTDDSLPGRGIPLDFTRTYASGNASTSGPLGYGWTDAYAMTAKPDATLGNTVMDITQEDGAVATFVENASGDWVPPSRVEATLTHDTQSGDWILTRGAQDTFTFDSSGQLVSESDLNGYTTTLTYTSGQLSTVTAPTNQTFTFTWGTCGSSSCITEISDPGARTVLYGYDGSGNLTSVTDVGGGVTHYGYDSAHRLVSVENSLGGTTTIAYGTGEVVSSETDPLGRTTTYAIGASTASGTGTTSITDPMGYVTKDVFNGGEMTSETQAAGTSSAATTSYGYYPGSDGTRSVTDPNGHTTVSVYDANGNLLSQTTPLGYTTSDTYNALNEVSSSTTPLGETTTYTYDAHGNLLSISEPLPSGGNAVTSYTYGDSSPGDVTAITDPRNHVWDYSYNSQGELASKTDPLGNETTYGYNAVGEKTSEVSPRGNVSGANPANFTTTYTYDAYGDLIQTVDPLGDTTKATYDSLGDKLTTTDANNNVTTYTYDADHELVSEQLAGGNCQASPKVLCTTYAYNADGEKTSATDARGYTTTDTYDPLGRLLSVTDPDQQTTSYTYDAAGNKVSMTDSMNNVTRYSYDKDNQLVQVTEPDTTTLSYTYDADGNKTSYTDGAGNVTAYSYNRLDQMTSTTDPLGNTTSYTYDAGGDKATMVNPDGQTTTYGYDAANDLTSVSFTDGSTAIGYSYDPNGNVSQMTDASGTTTYTYNDADRLISTTNGAGATVSYGYDPADNLTSLTYPNGKTATYSYNALEQMASVEDWSANKTTFVYDPSGNLTGVTYPNGITQTATYDPASETSSITDTLDGSTIIGFAYGRDKDGLVTSEQDTGTPGSKNVTYSFNSLNELTSAGSSSYQYSSGRNLTTGPTGLSQQFNASDELCWAGTGSGACSAPASGAITYSYSNEGNLTTVTAGTGTTTYGWDQANKLTSLDTGTSASSYVYDGAGLLQSEITNGVTTDYTWSSPSGLALLLEDGANYYIYGPGDTPIEQIGTSSGDTSYLLADNSGSVRATTDPSGAVIGESTYDPWGNTIATSGTAMTPFGFGGAYLESSAHLYYMRARWYDAATGQFISVDPAVAVTLYPFQYANNDPLNGIDPSGLMVLSLRARLGYEMFSPPPRRPAPATPSYVVPTPRSPSPAAFAHAEVGNADPSPMQQVPVQLLVAVAPASMRSVTITHATSPINVHLAGGFAFNIGVSSGNRKWDLKDPLNAGSHVTIPRPRQVPGPAISVPSVGTMTAVNVQPPAGVPTSITLAVGPEQPAGMDAIDPTELEVEYGPSDAYARQRFIDPSNVDWIQVNYMTYLAYAPESERKWYLSH